jgi:hypothetical protein
MSVAGTLKRLWVWFTVEIPAYYAILIILIACVASFALLKYFFIGAAP